VIAAILAAEEGPQSEGIQGMQGDHLHPRAATRAPSLPYSTPAPTDTRGQQEAREPQGANGQHGAVEQQEAREQRGVMGQRGARGQQDAVEQQSVTGRQGTRGQQEAINRPSMGASSLASRIAAEHNLDLSQVKSAGKRI